MCVDPETDFINILTKMLKMSGEFKKAEEFWKLESIKYKSKHMCECKYYESKRREAFYDNVRIITEIYYNILDWFDTVFVINGVVKQQRLINKVYEKYFELKPILEAEYDTQTDEKKYTVKVCLDQLKETVAILKPYVTETYVTEPYITKKYVTEPYVTEPEVKGRPKRNCAQIDYTGMDTIEPLSEYDGITNIWADTTIYEDPDYEPSAFEEEDDDEYEEEDFVLEQVSSNHIRFVY
jgi:hypothetical protein